MVNGRGGEDEQRCRQNGTPEFQGGRARGDRQTAHLGRSVFRLTREGKVFEAGGVYVVVVKRQK
jgi:hypothetical protein